MCSTSVDFLESSVCKCAGKTLVGGCFILLDFELFFFGFCTFKSAFYFSAKMSRKLSLPTDLKPDLGK